MKNKINTFENFLIISGYFNALPLPILINIWTIGDIFTKDGKIDSVPVQILIWLFDIVSVVISVSCIRYSHRVRIKVKEYVINTLLCFVSVLLVLGLFEVTLKTGIFDGTDNPYPIWIPEKFKKIDREIDKKNREIAKHNSFSFNDKERTVNKPEGIDLRIAVLGDSFVWGYGVPYDQAWGHKLEKKISRLFQKIEVINWGLCGWSTKDQFEFLKEHGIKYNIDFLLVGFVTNDPDMYDENYLKFLKWQDSNSIKPIRLILPDTVDFISSYLNNFLYQTVLKDYGYLSWEENLYTDENLAKYNSLLKEFADFCRKNNIRFMFVMTPNTYYPRFKRIYDKIIPLFRENHIEYLDLYPAVYNNLKNYNLRKLWANPADAHPGGLVTEVYANEVFQYLLKSNIISDSNKMSEK